MRRQIVWRFRNLILFKGFKRFAVSVAALTSLFIASLCLWLARDTITLIGVLFGGLGLFMSYTVLWHGLFEGVDFQ